ncbi:hypothetical protein QBC36DRAFT_374817 [Triangularia setosa]|uniref:Uncharacterized protein n=1 Tax=Triangularia setosa TaxID=2587417 RepID=A0AAN6WFA5_9PEZI|nr:hypothetical protein QBC36DRAFT_374817 [Podospora setosa]
MEVQNSSRPNRRFSMSDVDWTQRPAPRIKYIDIVRGVARGAARIVQNITVKVLAPARPNRSMEATPSDYDGGAEMEDAGSEPDLEPEDCIALDSANKLINMRHDRPGSLPATSPVPEMMDNDSDVTEDDDSIPNHPALLPSAPPTASADKRPDHDVAERGHQAPGDTNSSSNSPSPPSATSGSPPAQTKEPTEKYKKELQAASRINQEGQLLTGDKQCTQCQAFDKSEKPRGARRAEVECRIKKENSACARCKAGRVGCSFVEKKTPEQPPAEE